MKQPGFLLFPLWIERSGLPRNLAAKCKNPHAWAVFRKIVELDLLNNSEPGTVEISARALGDATVMALPAAVFQSWLLEAVTHWQVLPPAVARSSEGLAPERLHFWRRAEASDPAPAIAASCAPLALREEPPRLLSGVPYLVTGASAGYRALAALLLTRPGLRLRLAADQASTVRSAAQARSA